MNLFRFSNAPSATATDQGQLSARGVLSLMRDHAWEIARIAGLVFALAVVYLYVASPLYSADVLVRVDAPEPNALGIALQNQDNAPPSAPSATAEMQVMQSRSVIQPVLERFRFDISATPVMVPLLGKIASKFANPGELSEPWLGLKTFAWGGEEIKIAALEVPRELEGERMQLVALGSNSYELQGPSGEHLLSGTVGKTESSYGVSMKVEQLVARPGTRFKVIRWNTLDAIAQFLAAVKVKAKEQDTGIVLITYNNEDPSLAAEVANALAQQYIASAVSARQRDDTSTLAFINSELPRLRADLKQSEEALNKFRMSSQSLQPTAESQAYLQGGIDFQRQISTLQLQRTQLLRTYQPDSQWVRNVDSQIAQLASAKSTFDARFGNMPTSERMSVELARDARVSESIYLGMVNKAEQLSVRRASTTGGVNIVDYALRPHRPIKPNSLLVLSGGAGIGLVAGVFFVFIRRHVMMGVTDPHFVERVTSVPVFGEVLFSPQQARLDQEISAATRRPTTARYGRTSGAAPARPLPSIAGADGGSSQNAAGVPRLGFSATRVLAARFPQDVTVEALRVVRTMLNRGLTHVSNNIVMFTGPTPSAGKSFVAANIAVLQAETGSRVLLIDADMRRGRLAYFFGQYNRGGLSDVLAGDADPSEFIRNVGIHGLSFMSCGSYPDNPAELLMKRRFKDMLQRMGQEYDLVIVDTPPFLAVTDAAIVAGEAGATILVLRSGMQSEYEITETVKKLERSEANLVGAIFNAIPLRRSNRNYGYATGYATLDLIEGSD